jgi:hypothetical protein
VAINQCGSAYGADRLKSPEIASDSSRNHSSRLRLLATYLFPGVAFLLASHSTIILYAVGVVQQQPQRTKITNSFSFQIEKRLPNAAASHETPPNYKASAAFLSSTVVCNVHSRDKEIG